MQGERRGRHRHDLAAHRKDPVDPPDAFLEVTVLDRRHRRDQQVADGVPRESRAIGARAVVGEAVLEDLVHHRLRVGQRRDAVADVAHRRDPELGPQHARRPAIVGDRDHGGQVARVLLQPAQQRRQPGPPADRHDPRAT
jgi:hypothetical protein